MAYQHQRRLVAHWQGIKLNEKPLNAATKLVAVYLASNIRSDGEFANSWFHPGNAIAEELGLNRSTAYKALGNLLAAGVFDCETMNSRGLRLYSLALECPEGCNDKDHYTPLEKTARDGFTAHRLPRLESPHTDNQSAVKADTSVRQKHTETRHWETDLPHTYKELLNKELDRDIDNQIIWTNSKLST